VTTAVADDAARRDASRSFVFRKIDAASHSHNNPMLIIVACTTTLSRHDPLF